MILSALRNAWIQKQSNNLTLRCNGSCLGHYFLQRVKDIPVNSMSECPEFWHVRDDRAMFLGTYVSEACSSYIAIYWYKVIQVCYIVVKENIFVVRRCIIRIRPFEYFSTSFVVSQYGTPCVPSPLGTKLKDRADRKVIIVSPSSQSQLLCFLSSFCGAVDKQLAF